MQTVVIKPILFGNLLNKFLFLRKSSNKKINKKKIKNFAKKVAVIDLDFFLTYNLSIEGYIKYSHLVNFQIGYTPT